MTRSAGRRDDRTSLRRDASYVFDIKDRADIGVSHGSSVRKRGGSMTLAQVVLLGHCSQGVVASRYAVLICQGRAPSWLSGKANAKWLRQVG